jgi:hypothetical protein
MERIQIYPDAVLSQEIKKDAARLGVTVSMLVSDILKRHYRLVPENALSDSELTAKVFEDVKSFISDKNVTEFDLNKASKTFSTIDMVYGGRPSTIRAKIGKEFAKKIGNGDFALVTVKKRNGKIARSVNNAAIYELKPEDKKTHTTQDETENS